MIGQERPVICSDCVRENQPHPVRLAQVQGQVMTFPGRHHGRSHKHSVNILDLLPEPGTEEYAGIVVELLRRASG